MVESKFKKYLIFLSVVFALALGCGLFLSIRLVSAANCCYHECNLGDPNKCDGDKVMECKTNCDSDHYYDWCEIQDCSLTGQTCAAGACGSAPTACTDGTAANACSAITGSPWYCNSSLALVEKCSACGCAGSWACSTAGTYCCDNACNGACSKAGCTYDKDPDCACHNGDGCCGLSCTNATDNDCPSGADTVLPAIGTFTATAASTSAAINYAVSDAGGSHLDRIEIWRAPDNSGIPGVWAEVPGLRETITASNLDNYTKSLTDNPGTGIWWYGLHVVDQAGNLKTEPSPAKITITGGPCTENWSCTAWSACASGIKTRTCTDANGCGTTASKPDENNFCLAVKIVNPPNNIFSKSVININFSMDVLGGQSPYNYFWKSNLAGDFSTGNNWASPNISTWALGSHIISASAQDDAGEIVSESMTIQIVPAGTMTAQTYLADKSVRADSLFYSCVVNNGVSPYTYEWKSDKIGIFAVNQSGSININSWPLGSHHITFTVKDYLGAVFTFEKDIEVADFMIQFSNPQNAYEKEQEFDVNFSANVSGGKTPYNFSWQSDKDGLLYANSTNNSNDWFQKNDLSLGYHKITLTVTDADGLIDSKIALIKINPLTPITVIIDSPVNSYTFQQGDIITFKESHSGGVFPNNYEWKSNLAGIISTNSTFTKNNLPIGNHTVMLTIKDIKGNYGQATINFIVTTPMPLTAAINNPVAGNYKAVDQVIDFKGLASGGVPPYTYKWSSNIDGILGTKEILSLNNLNPGNHAITFQVQDAIGTVKAAVTNITVNAGCSVNNIKNATKYQPKETFLIPDNNWRDALSLVSVAVWQEGMNVKKYPALVYHQETTGFDADSTIHFLQMYNPDRLTTVGMIPTDLNNLLTAASPTGAGIASGNITNTSPSNYFSYWSSFNALVVADYSNYKAGLLASVLASSKNAPLIFVNSANLAGYQAMISGKTIFVVDNLDAATQNYIDINAGCQVKYTIDELQKWYAVDTESDKLLLINPKDLNIMVSASFTPEKSAAISKQFGGMSLAAPFLAAARQEIIVFSELNDPGANGCMVTQNFNSTNSLMASLISNLSKISNLNYLTVVASPPAIIDSILCDCSVDNLCRKSTDWQYGSLSDNPDDDMLKPGRIYGVTVADASSHINTSLYYNQIVDNIYASSFYSGVSIGHSFTEFENIAWQINNKAQAAGYNSECFTGNAVTGCTKNVKPTFTVYKNRQYIDFHDHGLSGEWSNTLVSSQIPWLDVPLVYGDACLTNNYWPLQGGVKTFGANMLRRGAISYFGNVGVALLSDDGLKAIKMFTFSSTRYSSGEVMSNLLNGNLNSSFNAVNQYKTILIGDPVVVPRFKQLVW